MSAEHVIDGSVYPDVAPPAALASSSDRADYVQRICGAWDFGIAPTPATLSLFAAWRGVFDAYPLRHSPAYAAFRTLFGWPRIPGSIVRARYELSDAAEGRAGDESPI